MDGCDYKMGDAAAFYLLCFQYFHTPQQAYAVTLR